MLDIKSLALRKSQYLGSYPKLDPKPFASQVVSGSKTQRQMGSGTGSEKNSFKPTTLQEQEINWLINKAIMQIKVNFFEDI
jgi:hypothetical protein